MVDRSLYLIHFSYPNQQVMQRFLQILTLAAGLEAVCVAQNAPQQAPAQNPPTQTADESRTTPAPAMTGLVGLDAQSTEEDTHSDLPQIPTLLGGRRTSMAFTPELERSNYLRGGLSVGAAYDDNTFLQPSDAVGN